MILSVFLWITHSNIGITLLMCPVYLDLANLAEVTAKNLLSPCIQSDHTGLVGPVYLFAVSVSYVRAFNPPVRIHGIRLASTIVDFQFRSSCHN